MRNLYRYTPATKDIKETQTTVGIIRTPKRCPKREQKLVTQTFHTPLDQFLGSEKGARAVHVNKHEKERKTNKHYAIPN
jgi:hypothetical protein